MSLADVTINSDLMVALAPVALIMLVGLITWIVRELSRISTIVTTLSERGQQIVEAQKDAADEDLIRDERFAKHVAEDAVTSSQVARIEGYLRGGGASGAPAARF
jgi:hypothetical protein